MMEKQALCGKRMPDQWGWQVFRTCQREHSHTGSHYGEFRSFGGAQYFAMMKDGDDHAREYTTRAQRTANRVALKADAS